MVCLTQSSSKKIKIKKIKKIEKLPKVARVIDARYRREHFMYCLPIASLHKTHCEIKKNNIVLFQVFKRFGILRNFYVYCKISVSNILQALPYAASIFESYKKSYMNLFSICGCWAIGRKVLNIYEHGLHKLLQHLNWWILWEHKYGNWK